MGTLFFARNDGDLDVLETGRFEELMKLHFAEAEPMICVKLAGALETVAEQIENHDATAFTQDAVGTGDGPLGVDCVVQRLAEDGEVYGAFVDRRVFDVAE